MEKDFDLAYYKLKFHMKNLRDDLHPVCTAEYSQERLKIQQQTNEINKKLFKSLYTQPHLQLKSKVEDDFNSIIMCMNVTKRT